MTHEETIKRIQELVPESIGEDLYRCNRVWEAWQMNTMSEDDFEIISQPITLAVVFQAIEYNKTEVELSIFANKILIGHYEKPNQEGYYTKCYWELSKDNFNDQSEETKSFIGGLLN